jgi:selenocysteine lyase/cysteine desulfurase
LPGTVRASFALHSDLSDIDRLAEALTDARQVLSR